METRSNKKTLLARKVDLCESTWGNVFGWIIEGQLQDGELQNFKKIEGIFVTLHFKSPI